MSDTGDKAKLFSKMAAIMAAISSIPKRGNNTFHNYKYAIASDVADAIREQMAAQNLAFFAETVAVHADGGRYVVEYLYTFACGDTGATHTCKWYGESLHTSSKGVLDDKALTKAATTAQKYFLLKTFIISTTDDPDVDEDHKTPTPQSAPAKPKAPRADAPPGYKPAPPPAKPGAWDATTAQAWAQKAMADTGLSQDDLLTALNVKRLGEWGKGAEEASATVTAYIDAQAVSEPAA